MGIKRKAHKPTIVVTGIATRLGRMLARALHNECFLIGIDRYGARHMPKDVTVHETDLRRKNAEDIFRRNRIDAVIHLRAESERGERGRVSPAVTGTTRLLQFCQKHDVPKVIVLSSAAVYGANPDNNQFLAEDSPLLAGQRYATMRELVEVDMHAGTYFWRHPEVDTVILRPVHVVGRLNNPVSRYLRLKTTPTIMGFDPMVQVISPEDVIHAIQLALKPGVRGIFNLAGPGPAPLSAIIKELGHRHLPVPEPLWLSAIAMFSSLGGSFIPRAELDYLKFVCMVDDTRARADLKFTPQLNLELTLEPLRT